jgi:hypothetical protein
MGTALERMRERTPFDILLDGSDRTDILRRLIDLLDELARLQIPYELSANNVPRSSHLWAPGAWTREDVISALEVEQQRVIDAEVAAKQAEEWLKSAEGQACVAMRERLDRIRNHLTSRWDSLGFDNLRPSEKNYVHVWWLCVEVETGAFQQYFDNSAGDTAMDALVALQSIGANDAYKILSDALNRFQSVGGFKTVRKERWESLILLPENAFDDETQRFYDLSEDLRAMALMKVELDYESVGISVA